MRSFSRGYTLIEVMVICTIIIILVTIAYGVFNSAREQARDKERMAELESLQILLRLYIEEYGTFPDCDDGIQIENGGTTLTTGGTDCTDGAQLQAFLTTNSAGSGMPADPLGPGDSDYYYYYDSDQQCNDPSSGSNTARVLYAVNMERVGNSNIASTCTSQTGPNDGGYLRTTFYGGTFNPSTPYVVILERL